MKSTMMLLSRKLPRTKKGFIKWATPELMFTSSSLKKKHEVE